MNRVFTRLACVLGICLAGRALAEEPLFEQDPYDQIILDESNGSALLKVKPLDLPGRLLPDKPSPDSNLVIRLVDQPDKKFEVAWKSIRKVELFEQMLLGKANELAAADKLNEAYDFFRFLEENYPRMPGLAAAYDEFLFKQAKAFFGKRQYRNALGVLRELHRRNPKRPKLDGAMGAMTDKLVEQYAAASDYPSIRGLLRSLVTCYPNHPLAVRWEARLKEEAAAQLAAARQARQAGDLRKASIAARRVALVWPTLAGAKELAEEIHSQYPRVIVGVRQAVAARLPGGSRNGLQLATDWAASRDARLVSRSFSELTAAGSRGGQYACPFGTVKTDESGRRLTVVLQRETAIDAFAVTRGLLAMADRTDASYSPEWTRVFAAVTTSDAYQLEIELGEGHLQPQALLTTVTLPGTRPYDPAEATAAESSYVLNPRYFARKSTQPREIAERVYADGAAAAAALRRAEIQVLDRLTPWQVKSLGTGDGVSVQPYALPRLHCLVPNARKPLTSNRTFRRALAYAIDRPAVLEQLLRGEVLPGCLPLHGPMPAGTGAEDPLGYASDPEVAPWTCDPRLAMGLAEGGRREAAGLEKLSAGDQPAAAARSTAGGDALVLAFPADDVARAACQAIRQQLAAADIIVELKELPAAPVAMPADVDLLYVEFAMWEPLVDAAHLLGENGPAGACSGPMSAALGQLQRAADWKEAGACLRRIDRLAHDEVAVVPLWQLPEWFAYRKDLAGIGQKTVTLYQDVEQWKPAFQYPSEK